MTDQLARGSFPQAPLNGPRICLHLGASLFSLQWKFAQVVGERTQFAPEGYGVTESMPGYVSRSSALCLPTPFRGALR